MSPPPYLGLVGPNASGKGVTAQHLEAVHGYSLHSLSDVLRDECRRRGQEPVRGNLIELGNELRRLHGPCVLAERVLPRLVPPALVDSIRNPEEVAVLRRLPGFVLISIDSPPTVRFPRSLARRRHGDPGTLKEFIAREEQENSADPAAQQLRTTAALADHHVENDATLADLRARVDDLIARLST